MCFSRNAMSGARACARCRLAVRIRDEACELGHGPPRRSFRKDVQSRARPCCALLSEHPPHERRPPVALLIEMGVALERGPGLLVNTVRCFARLVAGNALAA